MSRVALTRTKLLIVAAIVVVAGGSAGLLSRDDNSKSQTPAVSSSTATTEISYKGEDGKDALTLLKQHAQVVTKSSSLGDYVTSINGNDGGGTKYWTFYVNGQESQVGAGAYVTKTSDNLQWKLQ